MATYREEVAAALGFPSVAAMDEHQEWLGRQQVMEEKISERVRTSGNVIDVRDLL